MENAIRKIVTIQPGGRIIIESADLPEGAEAEVIVLTHPRPRVRSYREMFGSGKGGFATPQEADAFLRKERDSWDE